MVSGFFSMIPIRFILYRLGVVIQILWVVDLQVPVFGLQAPGDLPE
jgi:hypothetical protein